MPARDRLRLPITESQRPAITVLAVALIFGVSRVLM